MSKHRRPPRRARLGSLTGSLTGRSPVQVGIAAGVVGALSLTGTVMASASDSSTVTTVTAGARTAKPMTVVRVSELSSPSAQLALRAAADSVREQHRAELAEARERARQKRLKAKREAARERAAEARVEARLEARASRSRGFSASSPAGGSVERMSASAANALDLAAGAAAGAYYVYGGAGPNGFDCSGFTSYVFAKMGISLPHSSSAQRSVVRSVSDPQPGDLVFVYNGGGGSIGHVGIYAGGGYWWEASNPSAGVGKHRAWSSAVSYGRVL